MLSENAKNSINKVLSFLDEHKDLNYNFSLVRLMHEKMVRRANEHFHQLPIERQRKIIEQVKENNKDELYAFLVEEGLINEECLTDEEA